MMKQIKKLIPAIALVSFIGIALANNQGQTSLCSQDGTQGYVKANPLNPDPTLPPLDEVNAGNMNDVGLFGTNFECTGTAQKKCHWVYNPDEPIVEKRWTQCNGDYERITP